MILYLLGVEKYRCRIDGREHARVPYKAATLQGIQFFAGARAGREWRCFNRSNFIFVRGQIPAALYLTAFTARQDVSSTSCRSQ